MATKQFLTLEGLTTYDGLIKQYIGTEDAKSIKSLTVSGNTVSFYKTADASGTAAYTVNMPDVSGFMEKIAEPAEGSILVSATNGNAVEYSNLTGYQVSNAVNATTGFDGDNTIASSLAGKMPIGDWSLHGYIVGTSTNGEVYDTEVGVGALKDAIGATTGFDGSNTIASALADKIDKIANATGGKIVTSTAQGEVAESATAISDLATNSFVGSIPQGATATTVVGYVDEAVAEAGDDAEITLVEAQTPTTGYLKTYELYQGGNAAANLVGKIDIPKDLVVTSGEIVVNPAGQPAGTYLKLTIANQATPVYINVADLCDVYTAQQSATQVQLAISATNEISATIVAGSVTATELASNAVTTAKIADDAVTADKVAISAHTESKTAGADGLAISVTTTDGQVSAVTGSIAANTYDAYGAAATAESNANTYTDNATAAIPTASIEALFA